MLTFYNICQPIIVGEQDCSFGAKGIIKKSIIFCIEF